MWCFFQILLYAGGKPYHWLFVYTVVGSDEHDYDWSGPPPTFPEDYKKDGEDNLPESNEEFGADYGNHPVPYGAPPPPPYEPPPPPPVTCSWTPWSAWNGRGGCGSSQSKTRSCSCSDGSGGDAGSCGGGQSTQTKSAPACTPAPYKPPAPQPYRKRRFRKRFWLSLILFMIINLAA